ncbi:hypothetical protein [Nostoc sp.]|uniref:hypothetical protein n=1 Tax=Nostoc sp. TaxID=1180 RepID=UPI002FF8D016
MNETSCVVNERTSYGNENNFILNVRFCVGNEFLEETPSNWKSRLHKLSSAYTTKPACTGLVV